MKNIFISCQSIDSSEPQMLIAKLMEKGFRINHSPRNPADAYDGRWIDWYDKGIKQAIHESEIFVIIIDYGWDSSTWMGIEAEEALDKAKTSDKYQMLYWNPNNIEINSISMLRYLIRRVPDEVDKIIEILTFPSIGLLRQ